MLRFLLTAILHRHVGLPSFPSTPSPSLAVVPLTIRSTVYDTDLVLRCDLVVHSHNDEPWLT